MQIKFNFFQVMHAKTLALLCILLLASFIHASCFKRLLYYKGLFFNMLFERIQDLC